MRNYSTCFSCKNEDSLICKDCYCFVYFSKKSFWERLQDKVEETLINWFLQ